MRNIFSVIIFSLLCNITFLTAQKTLTKGTTTMEITNVLSEDPQMQMILEGIKGSQTILVFAEDKYVSSSDIMGGMVKITSHVSKKDNMMNMLFESMGNKIWVESTLDKAQTQQQKEIAMKNSVTYDKNDTKEILGYKCYKMTVTNPEMQEMTLTGYVAPEILTKANIIQGFQSVEFEGFPLEYTMKNKMGSITMTAKEVTDKVDESKFVLDTKGFKKMTMEEFQKLAESMGMGF
jgi:hypothetical protein